MMILRLAELGSISAVSNVPASLKRPYMTSRVGKVHFYIQQEG